VSEEHTIMPFCSKYIDSVSVSWKVCGRGYQSVVVFMESRRFSSTEVTPRSTPKIIDTLQASLVEQRPIVIEEIRSFSQCKLNGRPDVLLDVLDPTFQAIGEFSAEAGCGLVAAFEESEVYMDGRQVFFFPVASFDGL
jgi:hypothetical protein